jgi:hypothetical protein
MRRRRVGLGHQRSAASNASWLDRDELPIDDNELAWQFGPMDFQPPQRQAVCGPPGMKRHSNRSLVARSFKDTDRAGDELTVANAAFCVGVREVVHDQNCTKAHYGWQGGTKDGIDIAFLDRSQSVCER